jgi:two-component system response regulator
LERRRGAPRSARHEVVVVRDGVEALDYLFARGAYAQRDPCVLPEVVLLDLKLPKIDGMEVLRRIRADDRTKLLPVVVLTSSNEERDVLGGYRAGCNSYIRKPVEFNQFAEAVRQLGLYWLVINERPPAPRTPGRASHSCMAAVTCDSFARSLKADPWHVPPDLRIYSENLVSREGSELRAFSITPYLLSIFEDYSRPKA